MYIYIYISLNYVYLLDDLLSCMFHAPRTMDELNSKTTQSPPNVPFSFSASNIGGTEQTMVDHQGLKNLLERYSNSSPPGTQPPNTSTVSRMGPTPSRRVMCQQFDPKRETARKTVCSLKTLQPNSNGLHPSSDGLHPSSDGLHPSSDGLHPNSNGLHPSSDGPSHVDTSKNAIEAKRLGMLLHEELPQGGIAAASLVSSDEGHGGLHGGLDSLPSNVLVGWLLACLVAWLLGWLLGCSVGGLVAWLLAWLLGCLVGCLVACAWLLGCLRGCLIA